MWKFHSGYIGKPHRTGNEIALRPKLGGHQGHGRNASSGCFYSVTHGAGGAATSMAIGGNDRLARAHHLIEHLIGDRC